MRWPTSLVLELEYSVNSTLRVSVKRVENHKSEVLFLMGYAGYKVESA